MKKTQNLDHGLTDRQLQVLQKIFAGQAEHIERVGLFGSRATGKFRPNSDIDLVLYGPIDEARLDRIWTELNDSGLPIGVDLVAYDLIAHAALKKHIDEVVQIIFTPDDLKRI